jgi:hypothetical protein
MSYSQLCIDYTTKIYQLDEPVEEDIIFNRENEALN